jgi:hypothetical protein
MTGTEMASETSVIFNKLTKEQTLMTGTEMTSKTSVILTN